MSPSKNGVVRWISGNDFANELFHGKNYLEDSSKKTSYSVEICEASVDPNTVWVYKVSLWEIFANACETRRAETAQSYWDSGMTLDKWLKSDLDPTEWEILLPTNKVISSRTITWKSFFSMFVLPEEWRDRNTLLSVFDKANAPWNHEENPLETALQSVLCILTIIVVYQFQLSLRA